MPNPSVPRIPPHPATDRDADIARIRHDLDILRDRYAMYGRMAVVWKWFVCVVIGLVSTAVPAMIVTLAVSGALTEAMLLAILSSVSATVTVVYFRGRGTRWIDMASMPFYGPLDPFKYYPDRQQRPRLRSDAQYLELQIAECEQRLSELTAGQPERPDGQ